MTDPKPQFAPDGSRIVWVKACKECGAGLNVEWCKHQPNFPGRRKVPETDEVGTDKPPQAEANPAQPQPSADEIESLCKYILEKNADSSVSKRIVQAYRREIERTQVIATGYAIVQKALEDKLKLAEAVCEAMDTQDKWDKPPNWDIDAVEHLKKYEELDAKTMAALAAWRKSTQPAAGSEGAE